MSCAALVAKVGIGATKEEVFAIKNRLKINTIRVRVGRDIDRYAICFNEGRTSVFEEV